MLIVNACSAQLTSAITAVLSGSITEAIKGFYKLRKAFLSLDGILDIETKYLKQLNNASRASLVSQTKAISPTTPQTSSNQGGSFTPIDEKQEPPLPENLPPIDVNGKNFELDPLLAAKVFTTHTDIFIHSGTRLCYGLLLLVFSMIESPVFNKILYIIGFKGDRDRGAQLLVRINGFLLLHFQFLKRVLAYSYALTSLSNRESLDSIFSKPFQIKRTLTSRSLTVAGNKISKFQQRYSWNCLTW